MIRLIMALLVVFVSLLAACTRNATTTTSNTNPSANPLSSQFFPKDAEGAPSPADAQPRRHRTAELITEYRLDDPENWTTIGSVTFRDGTAILKATKGKPSYLKRTFDIPADAVVVHFDYRVINVSTPDLSPDFSLERSHPDNFNLDIGNVPVIHTSLSRLLLGRLRPERVAAPWMAGKQVEFQFFLSAGGDAVAEVQIEKVAIYRLVYR